MKYKFTISNYINFLLVNISEFKYYREQNKNALGYRMRMFFSRKCDMRFATENNVFKNCDSEKNKKCNVYLNIEM